MEIVLFIGIQASGKSTFYVDRFSDTHIRLNLDMLKTRHREKILFNACLEAKQPIVIDNTNPTKKNRERYIIPALEHKFKIVGYYFQSKIDDCIKRNSKRKVKISLIGIRCIHSLLELPSYAENFDELYYVSINENNAFIIDKWKEENEYTTIEE